MPDFIRLPDQSWCRKQYILMVEACKEEELSVDLPTPIPPRLLIHIGVGDQRDRRSYPFETFSAACIARDTLIRELEKDA